MEVWLATGNKGKISDFQKLMEGFPFEIHGQSEMSYFTQPPEDGDSFLANARIKAKSLHAIKDQAWVIADDSGLCVEGLGGLPGIHSARYAGENASSSENNAKLLKMMQFRSPTNRKAYFHCSLVAIDPTGKEYTFDGKLQGEIPKAARGTGGFGYDPVFIPEGWEKTLGESTAAEKNAISHRAQAFSGLIDILKKSV